MHGTVVLIVLAVSAVLFVLKYFHVPTLAVSVLGGLAGSYGRLLIAVIVIALALFALYFLSWVLMRWLVHLLVLKLGELPEPVDCNSLIETNAVDSGLTLIIQMHAAKMDYAGRGYSLHYGTTRELGEKIKRGAAAGVNIASKEIWLNIGWVIRHPTKSINRTREIWLKSTLVHEDAHIRFGS